MRQTGLNEIIIKAITIRSSECLNKLFYKMLVITIQTISVSVPKNKLQILVETI